MADDGISNIVSGDSPEEIAPEVSPQKNFVLGRLESIVKRTAQFTRHTLETAEHYYHAYAPIELQFGVDRTLRAVGAPSRVAKRHAKAYLDNLFSFRYLSYQAIGGTASVLTKVGLSLTLLDDPGYVNQLQLVIAGAVGHTLVQWPLYLYLEHRKYGQSVKELNMEYWAWRSLEALVLNAPTYFIAAGQGSLVENFGGVTAGAISTSAIPGTPAKWFSNGIDSPVMHGIYRRLQIRKENGIPMDEKEVYHILKNGAITASTIIGDTVYNFTIKPVRNLLKS